MVGATVIEAVTFGTCFKSEAARERASLIAPRSMSAAIPMV
jgi:hypothetical protein